MLHKTRIINIADTIITNDACRVATYVNWLGRHTEEVRIRLGSDGRWCIEIRDPDGTRREHWSVNMIEALSEAVVQVNASQLQTESP